jgi:hypothetical protein
MMIICDPDTRSVRRDEADRLRDLRREGERQVAADRADAALLMFRAKESA